MIDHAEVVIGDWPLRGPTSQVLRFEDTIPEIQTVTNGGVVVPVFGSTNRSNDDRWFEIKLSKGRRGNVTYQTRPIIAGLINRAKVAGRVPRHTPGEHICLGLDARLNVNIFLMAQTVRQSSRLGRPRLDTPLAAAIDGAFAAYGTERCRIADMIVLIGPPRLYRYALSKPAEDHFMDCLRLMESFMISEMQETAHSYGEPVDHVPYYSLRKIEFVWGFLVPTPSGLWKA